MSFDGITWDLTKPLDPARSDLRVGVEQLIERLYRPRAPQPEPRHTIDWDKATQHNIAMVYDATADMWLMSLAELRRAEELGIIRSTPA